ncbi:hypothetical protein CDCA_CDCA17G4453 [Cyanidium caldarium]|uniref:Uncharacterized protein n=1 Tax=Cyanidium caldarium TaxID=2771 RepID=A0AAV9J301_CYACA|nr:hypothetical protein CDCA_CDCA17G4453 [Cyanidium caldarium]
MESQHPALCCLVAGGNVNATTTPGATSPTNRSACPVFTWAFVLVAAHQTWREACAAALPPHLQPCIRMGEAHLPHAFFGTSFEAPPDSVLPVTARCTVLFLLAPGMPGEHAPLHRRSKRSRRRSTSPPPASPPLSRSVLLSALQKCIRRGRVLSAVRLAHTIYQAHGMAILTRRLLVITVEDGLLHPAAPLLAWYMGASTKGYRVSTADVDAVLQYVAEVATVRERDTRVEHRFSTVESFQRAWRPYESAFRLRLDVPQQALVAALFLRSLYGGMHGDQRMLREYALEWTRRFLSEVPPPETVSERVLKSETRDMCGTSDRCATWYVTPGTSCPWIRFLELSYTRTRQALQRRVPDGVCVANIGPLTVHDIPLAAIGPYSGIRLPSEDAARGTVWGAVYDAVRRYAPNTDPVDALSSLVWHLRSKLNVRRDMWCAPASSEARAAAADDDDDDSDQQVPPFPHFQNTEQAACWRLVAPVLERAARAYLRRRFRPAFADTSPTT